MPVLDKIAAQLIPGIRLAILACTLLALGLFTFVAGFVVSFVLIAVAFYEYLQGVKNGKRG